MISGTYREKTLSDRFAKKEKIYHKSTKPNLVDKELELKIISELSND